MAGRNNLFRPEAIEFQQQQRHWGEIVLLQPIPTRILSWCAVAALACILAFLFSAQYARKETVSGYLTPSIGTARIFVPRAGVIRAVHVQEGQEVAAGQPLLTIETDEIAASGEDVNASILATLAQQRALLEAQIAREEERAPSEQRKFSATIDSLQAEIASLKNQITLQNQRIELSHAIVTPAAELSTRGFMSDLELKRRQELLLDEKQRLEALQQEVHARESQLADAQYALGQAPTAIAEKVQLLRNELANAEQRVAEINGRRAYVIQAPASGRVSALHATPGQAADPRVLQLAIMPPDSTLKAELYVPTRAVGFVRAGQPVRVLYDAFPYQSFGTYGGRIETVSQTILTASDVSGPISLSEPAYRVTARLDRPDVDAYGRRVPLQPGMLLKADIILEKRSLLKWLLDPLLSART